MIDLHRHHGGSLTPDWVHATLERQKGTCGYNIKSRLTFDNDHVRTFSNFLSKFTILDEIRWDEATIRDSIGNVCWGIRAERLQYAEVKVSLHKFMRHTNLSPTEIIKIIRKQFDEESEKWDISVGLVLSLKYEADRDEQRKIASLITGDASECLVGIDLVGDEACYDSTYYEGICREWKQVGKGVEAHVGESQSHENVRTAILRLKVDRIAHGIRAINHPDIMSLAADNNVCFDMALTSNYYTGVADYETHPIRVLLEKRIVPVTLGTDDPVVLGTTLSMEYEKARRYFGLSDDDLSWLIDNSMRFAFGYASIG